MTRTRTIAATSCAALTLGLLAPVQMVVERPMLLAERLVPGGGWVEMVLLALYAGVVAAAMVDPKRSGIWRVRIWRLFSAVFFLQFVLGVAGVDVMLMTGKLHLPVPAVILAGPLYRGGGLFMIVLFGITVVLVGPAWCSHLCYIGSWDDAAARRKKRPAPLPRWRRAVNVAMVGAVAATALVLNVTRVPGLVAGILGASFGAVGVLVMLLWSRRTGAMTHCVTFCPMGVLATWLGKVNPFRIRIHEGCDQCGLCTLACRYDALNAEHLARRRVGMSCTLCGDCVGRCKKARIGYWLPGVSAHAARTTFIVLAVALHAVFMGVARL